MAFAAAVANAEPDPSALARGLTGIGEVGILAGGAVGRGGICFNPRREEGRDETKGERFSSRSPTSLILLVVGAVLVVGGRVLEDEVVAWSAPS